MAAIVGSSRISLLPTAPKNVLSVFGGPELSKRDETLTYLLNGRHESTIL